MAIDRFTSDGTERRDPEPLATVDVILAIETACKKLKPAEDEEIKAKVVKIIKSSRSAETNVN